MCNTVKQNTYSVDCQKCYQLFLNFLADYGEIIIMDLQPCQYYIVYLVVQKLNQKNIDIIIININF